MEEDDHDLCTRVRNRALKGARTASKLSTPVDVSERQDVSLLRLIRRVGQEEEEERC